MQNIGLERNTIDKYYTKSDVVTSCIELFEDFVNPDKDDIFIEPSAGSGSFSKQLEKYKNLVAIDIDPDNENIETQDFLLDFDINKIKQKFKQEKTEKDIHIIGNPPFGRQSSFAKKFIKKSSTFANTISFILPRSFKKDSFQKTFPLCFHLIFSFNIPDNAFLVNDKEYDVPCVFQIWMKKDTNRIIHIQEKPEFFDYVIKDDDPDISFRRVGVNSGDISKDIVSKSFQSHYFLKFKNNIDIDHFIKIYNDNKNFSFNNTVGPKSISKGELNLFLSSISHFF